MAPRAFSDYMKEFGSVFPNVMDGERESLCWQSIKNICSENDLSFMIDDAKIITEAAYSTGTIAIAGGTNVTLTGGTWSIAWTNRKIVIRGQTEPYGITVTGANTGTLSEAWQGSAITGLTYRMFRDIYEGPSNCEYSKELLLWDTTNNCRVDFYDFATFRRRKREYEYVTGTPDRVSRVDLTATGVPQLEFGLEVPSSKIIYLLDYYRSPVKPANLAAALSPVWPDAFSHVIWERMLMDYTKKRGHSRRFEFERDYKSSIFRMNANFNGSDEMKRRVARDTRQDAGLRVRVRYDG
jgi:hypothetical protein